MWSYETICTLNFEMVYLVTHIKIYLGDFVLAQKIWEDCYIA